MQLAVCIYTVYMCVCMALRSLMTVIGIKTATQYQFSKGQTDKKERFADMVKTHEEMSWKWRGGEEMARNAGCRSYLHEVGRVAGWGYPPLGREFPP